MFSFKQPLFFYRLNLWEISREAVTQTQRELEDGDNVMENEESYRSLERLKEHNVQFQQYSAKLLKINIFEFMLIASFFILEMIAKLVPC